MEKTRMKQKAIFLAPTDFNVPFAVKSIGITYKDSNYRIHRALDKSYIYVLEYVISGRGVVNTPTGTFYPSAGDSFFLRANEIHDFYSVPEDPMEKIWVTVVGTLTPAMLESYGLTQSMLLPGIDTSHYIEQLMRIVKNSENDEEAMNAQCCIVFHRLCQFVHKNLRVYNETTAIPENIVRLKNYIDSHLDEPLTIEKCNSITYLSSSQTTRQFRKYYAMAPYEYLNNQRIQWAQELLRTSSYTIHDIAKQLGFQDQSYFSKYFKKKCGKSPTEYRDSQEDVSHMSF